MLDGSNYDSLFVRTVAFPVQVAYCIKEVIAPCGTSVPCQLRPEVRRHGRGVLWARGDSCMTGCLECPLASPVLAQSWSQTATDGAWYSTTALLSGRDRPLCLCVLRPRGSEPKTRRTGVWRPPPQASASSWRALANGVRLLSVTNRCWGQKSANARPRIRTFSVPYVVHVQRFVGGAPT